MLSNMFQDPMPQVLVNQKLVPISFLNLEIVEFCKINTFFSWLSLHTNQLVDPSLGVIP